MTIQSLVTIEERSRLAYRTIVGITGGSSNVYVGIGHNQPWATNDTLIEIPVETIDYFNQTFRNLCALKLVQVASACVVARRVDWANNTIYDPFDEATQMYSYEKLHTGNGTITVSNTNVITGVNTTFQLDFITGHHLLLNGDSINLFPQQREVVTITSNTSMVVNSAFSGSFVANTPVDVSNTYPFYAKTFYVRNTFDQVFICLDNKFGSPSTVFPALSIGGDLPSSPYILTSDGYKWKYLYTIQPGLKQSFFTTDYMPVATETQVTQSAVNGRLDIIKINNGGSGYNNGAASFSAPIVNVIGDGTGANVTAQVDANGTIQGVNILNAGQNYTTATITVNSGVTGVNANLTAEIGPSGGWGSNSGVELGATTLMFSVDLNGTENGTIPTVDSLGNFFNYRQLTLISDPTYAANGNTANGQNYDTTTVINVSANTPFAMNDLVFQSANGNYAGATFTGKIVWFDNSTNVLHINNVSGTFQPQTSLFGTKDANSVPYSTVTAFSITQPTIQLFTGRILYIENRTPVQRAPAQVENVKLIIGF
jgi:hypothetical protein